MPLIFDASVLINLNATGISVQILNAIPNPVVIMDVVARELESGRKKGRTDADMVAALIASGRARLASLSAECEGSFMTMVSGSGATTLDDGEAATIAWADAFGGVPIIDERKGLAICHDRFPHLQCGTTTDLFAHKGVLETIEKPELADAIFKALTLARMRVQDQHISWVVDMIGVTRARECRSLPLAARSR